MPTTPNQPLDPAIIQRAGQWWARLAADDASEADRTHCAQWRAQHPDHERAWQALQAFDSQLLAVPADVAQHVLKDSAERKKRNARTRRQFLGLAALGAGVGTIAYLGRDSEMWKMARAQHRTATGEIRQLQLNDGTQIVLGSASAIDVDYAATHRRILLRAGHIMVTTTTDPAPNSRPFSVQTRHGTATALGTQFAVHLHDERTTLEVFKGAVLISPHPAPGQILRVEAGQATEFNAMQVQVPEAVDATAQGWTQGTLSITDMRLGDVIEWLGRYRSGILHCDPAVANLPVTGTFPLHDTDRALHNLTLGLPVRLRWRTRYWVTVVPR